MNSDGIETGPQGLPDDRPGGRLGGIARHDRPKGPIEVIDSARITRLAGIEGDWRGAIKPGANRRQISMMEAESWHAAMAGLGADLPWWVRRANLLVTGLRLPREAGYRVRIGHDCLIEVTMECNPCERMETVERGLMRALAPDWRGGALGRVLEPGRIAVNDTIRIET